jgi:hypothetical protein
MRMTPSQALIERVYRVPLKEVLSAEIRKRRTVEGALTAINKRIAPWSVSRTTAFAWMKALDLSAVEIKRGNHN